MFSHRLDRARALMHNKGMDFIVVGPSADLVYLSGMHNRPSERLTLFVLSQEGPVHIVLPGFEAPLLPDLPLNSQVHTWGESDSPARIVANILSRQGHSHPGGFHCTIGVADRLWSTFLLALQAELPRASFTGASSVLAALRQTKYEQELSLLAESASAADAVFAQIVEQRFTGRSELEIAREIAHLLEAQGLMLEGAPIVASGPNSASPHHHAGARAVAPGDTVLLDFGGTVHGYFSDITRTVFAGHAPEPDSEQTRVYNIVAAAQQAAVEAARPGMACEVLDSVARNVIARDGYGEYFNHRLGHGIGLDGHEQPYLVQGNTSPLQAHMTFSIEPGIYLPGNFGVRIEDIVVLEESGARSLNNAPKEITVVS